MDVTQKIEHAIEHPEWIIPHFKLPLFGKYVWPPRFKPYYKHNLDEFEMYLRATNRGLSAELARNGIREPIKTHVYQSKLQELYKIVDDIVVMEIGANIGYYLLVAATAVEADFIAAELDQDNIDMLRRNIDLNELNDNVEIFHTAVGASSSEKTTVYDSTHSNQYSLKENNLPTSTGQVAKTQMTTARDLVEDSRFSPSEINVLRMDVEGYEYQVIRGMQEILETNSPFLIGIEIHPQLLEEGELQKISDLFRSQNFDICVAAKQGEELKIEEVDEMTDFEGLAGVEMVLKRGF